MTRHKIASLMVVSFGLLLLLSPMVLKPRPVMIYNPSPSAQIGWYRVSHANVLSRGDLVTSRLPDHARRLANERGYLPSGIPVIKTIGAVGGDEVCWTASSAFLPDGTVLKLQSTDSAGQPLPQYHSGCLVLPSETVFLVSTRTEASFDSRYIGPFHTSFVIGKVRYIGRRDVQVDAQGADLAWARALGADCKIKAGSAAKGLTPCLHVISYSAIEGFTALSFLQNRFYFSSLGQRYFTARHIFSPGRRR